MESVENFILLFCVWFESRDLGSRGSSRFSCVSPVVETFSERVTFRILPNVSDVAPQQKQPAVLTLISRCQAFSQSNWHLSSFPSVNALLFSSYLNLFYTFVFLTFFKFVGIFQQKLRSSRLGVFCKKGVLGEDLRWLLLEISL